MRICMCSIPFFLFYSLQISTNSLLSLLRSSNPHQFPPISLVFFRFSPLSRLFLLLLQILSLYSLLLNIVARLTFSFIWTLSLFTVLLSPSFISLSLSLCLSLSLSLCLSLCVSLSLSTL